MWNVLQQQISKYVCLCLHIKYTPTIFMVKYKLFELVTSAYKTTTQQETYMVSRYQLQFNVLYSFLFVNCFNWKKYQQICPEKISVHTKEDCNEHITCHEIIFHPLKAWNIGFFEHVICLLSSTSHFILWKLGLFQVYRSYVRFCTFFCESKCKGAFVQVLCVLHRKDGYRVFFNFWKDE